MQISSRFTIAIHILTAIDTFQNDYKVTSDFLGGSVNVNPVIIRRTMQALKGAGLIEVKRGTAVWLLQGQWIRLLYWIFLMQ